MIRIILHGYMGRMGKALIDLIEKRDDVEVVAGIDINRIEDLQFKTFKNSKECDIEGDVIIDFSNHDALNDLLDFAKDKKLPLVIATTALTEDIEKKINDAKENIPIFISANMSIGVNVVAECLKNIVHVLENDYNIEIIEKHHSLKKDAPSGTAILLADAIKENSKIDRRYVYGRQGSNEERSFEEIGIHALRGGTIPGEHTIIFAGDDEVIEIKHTALSRKIFAKGAVQGALFISKKKTGIYSMKDIIRK